MTGSRRPTLVAGALLAVALGAALVWAVLPAGIGRDVLAAAFAPAAGVAVAIGVRPKLGPGYRGWVLVVAALLVLGVGGGLGAAAGAGAGIHDAVPEAVHLGAPALLLGAFLYLARQRGRVHERGAVIDALIVGVALFSVTWVAVIEAATGSDLPAWELVLAVAEPILYLAAAAVMTAILVAPGRRHPAIVLLSGGALLLLAGAIIHGWQLIVAGDHDAVGGVIPSVAGYALLAGAAFFPAVRGKRTASRPDATRLTPLRISVLATTSFVPTVILAVRAPQDASDTEVAAYAASAAVVAVATLLRTIGLLGQNRRAFAREEMLRRTAGQLAAALDREAIHHAAVDGALDIVDDPQARTSLSLVTGTGITVTAAAAGHEAANLVGLELPPASLELARRALLGASVEVRARDLPDVGLVSGDDPVVFVPLVVGDEGIGLLGVRSRTPLDEDTRTALETLSVQVALALDGLNQSDAAAQARVERRFRALVEHATDLVTLVDADMRIRFQSPSVEAALGWTPEQVIGHTPLALVHPADRKRVILFWRQVRAHSGVHPPVDFRALTREGGWRTMETIANNLLDDPDLGSVVLTSRDISERRELETRLAHQAFHDELTGLANRALFVDRVEHSLAVAAREERSVAVLFLDLDDFKEVNDSLGHQAGDLLLIETARRIESCLRQGDTAARLSGDEFGILIERATRETATAVAERVLERLRDPITIARKELFLRASVGIALSGSDGSAADELLRNADTAMYRAKSAGKSAFALFQPSMHLAALQRLELRSDLEGAAARGEMSLRYQPIFSLQTGTIAGFEALLRWSHPRRGEVPPQSFVPLAEETGSIVPLGAWVFETAVRQLAAWERRWPEQARDLWLSINVSARQLAEPTLPDTIAGIVAASGVDPSRLIVEVTESALVADAEDAAHRLSALRAIGLRVAVDDFGTGYSSLGVLEQMPVDVLKIASRFVDRLGTEERRPRLVEAMVRLGDTLGLPTVAEGIENVTQLTVLQLLGCELGQGFYMSRPLRVDRVEGLLARAAAGDPLVIGGLS